MPVAHTKHTALRAYTTLRWRAFSFGRILRPHSHWENYITFHINFLIIDQWKIQPEKDGNISGVRKYIALR